MVFRAWSPCRDRRGAEGRAGTARHRGLVGVVAVLAFLGSSGVYAWVEPPPVVRASDSGRDRGNQERHAHVTGATTPVGRLYNGDTEISFWNRPAAFTFSLAKNDVWDRRYFGDSKRVITLADVRRVCFEGEIGRSSDLGLPNAPQALYSAYDFPCPKPVGQIVVRCPGLVGVGDYEAGVAEDGSVVARAEKGAAQAVLWSHLHRTRNLLVVQGRYTGTGSAVSVELYRHRDTTPVGTSIVGLVHHGGRTGYDYSTDAPANGPLPAPEAGADGRFFWIRQAFPAEKTFPGGFECVLMAVLVGADAAIEVRNGASDGGERATIHPILDDVHKRLAGWLKQKRMAVERVNNAASGCSATATITTPDPSFALVAATVTTRDHPRPLQRARELLDSAVGVGAGGLLTESRSASAESLRTWHEGRVMHYNATSCTYADSTPWHGDYHFNEGHFLPTIVQGKGVDLEPRFAMFEGMLPALHRNAEEVYGCRGIFFPLVHYPIKHDRVVYANVTWEWGIENTAFMLQPYWQRFQYEQDAGFLRDRAYPMMRRAALFYEDYVTLGDDGAYHVVPTVSQEHWGFTPGFRLNRDSVGALSFTKYHLRACAEAAEALGVDEEARARWLHIADHLAPYPTLATEAGPVFCDVRDAARLLNYNITANLIMVLWAEDISLDSPPELLEMARRTYGAIPGREHSPRPGYLRRIRLYLGMLETPWLCAQGRVLSWPGRIHLYAGVPFGSRVNDSFSGHLAVGGFEVSASHVQTDVQRVRITSRVGKRCRVKNPWNSPDVLVMDWGSKRLVEHGLRAGTIEFDTEPGRTYALVPPAEAERARLRFVPKREVVGRWDFAGQDEDTVPDRSGKGHGAALVDGACLTVEQGESVMRLPGDGAYARVERTASFDFGLYQSFSVEARMRIPPTPSTSMIPVVCSMSARQYCLVLRHGRVRFYLSSPKGQVFSFADGRTVVTDGEWHHIRGMRDVDSATVKVFVDGRLEGESSDRTNGDFACTVPVTIGAYLYGERTCFAAGWFDDVEIVSLGGLE